MCCQPARSLIPVLLVLLGLVSLGGCAIIHKPPTLKAGIADPAAWQAHKKQLERLTQWALQGRVASGQLLGWTGNLNWRQDGNHFIVRLSGPLGAGGFSARGTLDKVHVRTEKGRFTTHQPDAVAARILGFAFPLSALRYWARGLPAPGGIDRISANTQGLLQSLRQNGWHVAFLAYTKVREGLKLPKRIVLDNDEHRLRLVVDRWFDLEMRNDSRN